MTLSKEAIEKQENQSTVRIDKVIHKKLQDYCRATGQTIKWVCERAIKKSLDTGLEK